MRPVMLGALRDSVYVRSKHCLESITEVTFIILDAYILTEICQIKLLTNTNLP